MSMVPDSHAIGAPVEALDTPCLLVDLDKVERNLDAMARAFAGGSVRLRPHAKTHKSPALAKMQMQRGAVGICCAKLGEAEVMAAAGIADILITTEVVGQSKIRRLLGLAKYARVTTVVDNADPAGQISDAAAAAGLRVDCLLDIDVGTNRTGVASGEPALALGLQVARMPGLNLIGVQGYEGHAQHVVDVAERRASNGAAMRLLSDTVDLLRANGLNIEIVSTAGTGTCEPAAQWDRVTEVQPGSYLFMDTDYGRVQGLQFEYALTVLASVISVRDNGVVVDAGLKSLTTDSGPARPIDAGTSYTPFGDEFGLLTFEQGGTLSIGARVSLIPSHCDPTVNLHDSYYVTRGGIVVGVWPVAGRGCSQ